MRILVFNWRDLKHSWAGGGEIYVFELAKRWVKMGHEVTIFCSQDPYKNLPEEETYQGVRVIRKGNRFTLYLWAPIFYFKKFRNNFDVIVDVQNGIPFFTPLFSRIPKISFVYHVHKTQFFYELTFPLNYVGYLTEKFIFPLIYRNTKIVAISKTTEDGLLDLGFNKKNIEIIYCGINNANRKDKEPIKKFMNPTLLYLGRIKAYKRVNLLVDIFREVLNFCPSARLIIAGWGTEAGGLTDLVMRSSLRKKVDILGPVSEEEKRSILSKSWVFVNLSIGEGWGISVIEANSYGTPAVAFDVPGLSESIKDEETGLIASDREDMVAKIVKLLNEKKYREEISENARKWAGTFSWDKAAEKNIALLKKIAKNE